MLLEKLVVITITINISDRLAFSSVVYEPFSPTYMCVDGNRRCRYVRPCPRSDFVLILGTCVHVAAECGEGGIIASGNTCLK
jgi:hypothetical protein